MRILFTTQPGTGHLHPLLPLAHALQADGHTVAFATSASFCPQISKYGWQTFPVGLDWLESEPEKVFPEMEDMSLSERDEMITEIFVDISANHMVHDLIPLCKEWKPDVIVRDYTEYGGCIVGELLQIPHAVVGLGMYLPDYITKFALQKPLAYIRSAYGLPPTPAMEMLTKYLYLSLLPPSFQVPSYPIPPVTHALQPASMSQAPESLPDWILNLPKQPTIFACLGTVFNLVPELYQLFIDAVRDKPVNLLIGLGRNIDPSQFDPVPDNVYVEEWIPQIPLMPYCDLVISHGGIGTILNTLGFGKPLIVIPLVGHQLQNISQCKRLGVAQALKPEFAKESFDIVNDLEDDAQNAAATLFAEEMALLTPDSLYTAIQKALTEPSYKNAAQALKQEMAQLPPISHGAELIIELAQQKKPIPANK